jgi:hypothetical protein
MGIAPISRGARRSVVCWLQLWAILVCALILVPHATDAQLTTPAAGAQPTKIVGLTNKEGTEKSPNLNLGMGDELVVELDADPVDATKWVLYLDGQAMPDLSDTAITHKAPPGLVYKLRRTDNHGDAKD